jgi:cold shock CspA family protein
MKLGRIKCFFHAKGYGFIEDYSGQEVYFHYTSCVDGNPDQIFDGAKVYFEAISTGIGLEAHRVQLAGA